MLQDGKQAISKRARSNANLLKADKENRNEFAYWLGYFDGQNDISNKDEVEWE